MAVTYSTALKTTRMTAVVTAIDAGSGAGKLKIYTAADALLATLTLADPSASVAGAVLTFDCTPVITVAASDSGEAAKATVTDSDDTVVISGLTVGTSSADIIVDSTTVTSGQTVSFNSGSITHG